MNDNTTQHNTTQHNTTQHNTTQHNTTQHKCLCQQCQNNEFKIEDFLVTEEDFKALDKERPFGISGHMRIKNEAMSVAECIDSCIDFLDELIITYNTSQDETENILKEYQKKYPDKIRLYHYKPNVFWIISEEDYRNMHTVHHADNYSNYGFVKIKYKYYMKIDADQIYFTGKLFELKKALLVDIDLEDLNKIKIMNKILWWIPIRKLRYSLREKFQISIKSKYFKHNYNNLSDIDNTYDFVINARINSNINDVALNMGGIDLSLFNNSFYLNNRRILNGCVSDHVIFYPTSINSYFMFEASKGLYQEHINYEQSLNDIGLFWVHLGAVKRKLGLDSSRILIDFFNIKDTKISKDIENIVLDIEDLIARECFTNFLSNFFENDKKYLTQEFCDRFLKKPLEYAIKYFNDK